MANTTAGLPNNGRTAHYLIQYDSTLSPVDGLTRAQGLYAACEADFALVKGWFGGIDLIFDYPIPVVIVSTGQPGGSWSDPSDWLVGLGTSPQITLDAGTLAQGGSVNVLRYILVSEVAEMFMASQDLGNDGWFEPTSLFSGADEGSKGEGLSRFLAIQFQVTNGLGNVAPFLSMPGGNGDFRVAPNWLRTNPRLNWVDYNPDDIQPDATNGCTTLFLLYLRDQLNHSPKGIVGAASNTLAGVYQKLTGRSDAWAAFNSLLESHFPTGRAYNPVADTVFPVPSLTTFGSPNQITCGYSDASQVVIDRPAPAEVYVALRSDDASVVSVPNEVVIPPGSTFATVTFSARAIAGWFPTKVVNVHATYAGQTLTARCEVVPPRLSSLTLAPDTIKNGESSTGTLSVNLPSKAGPVVASVVSSSPGNAVAGSPVITIAQGATSQDFGIASPDSGVAHKTAKATIVATYGDIADPVNSVMAILLVKSRIVAGIVQSLTLMPTTVTAGDTSRGTVTLVEPVPVKTIVGLAALEPGTGLSPKPGNASSVASVLPSITIDKNETVGHFTITTTEALPPGTVHKATIVVRAVATVLASLTVEGG